MLESLKGILKERFPYIVDLHAALVRERSHVIDAYYSRRPFSPGNIRPTPYGFKFGGGNSVHHKAMQEGRFEPEEVVLMQRLLQSTDVFVDVGANIGFYACMARHAGKQAIAVEPQAGNLRYLYSNLLANGWGDTEVFPMGLGSASGLVTLYGFSSTGASLIPGWAGASQRTQRVIPVTTLDTLLGNRFPRKKLFIKIDVEGVEYEVLKGADTVLASAPKPVWIVEICLKEHYPDGMNPKYEDTFRIFWERGYQASTAERDPRPVTPEDVADQVRTGRNRSGVINYIFTPAAT
jgi:FkbM family methyltransferase